MSPAKLTNKFLFAFGRESAARRLALRGEFAQLRAQLAQLARFGRILLRRCRREVREVKPGSVFVQRGDDARRGSVFGVEQMRGERQSRGEGEARVHEALNRRVAQGPVVHLHGLERAQAVQMVRGGGERVERLQERVVELQRRVQRDRRR